ncbi:MAG TPA: hypothetical protein PLR39_02665 [Treponemataceae bacterium]|nr:hypothetical protein [Treponemataceae bacterium]
MKTTLRCLTAIMFLSLSSCMQSVYKAPFIIGEPECVIGEVDSFFRYAGIILDFCNTSEKQIMNIEISFSLFDPETKKSPWYGTSHIMTNYENSILTGEKIEICVSLDTYLYEIPKNAFLVKNLCISALTYSDGSVWKDYLGIYTVDSN